MPAGSSAERELFTTAMPSPVGRLRLVAHDQALVAVLWEHDDPRRVPLPSAIARDDHPLLRQATQQLREYFDGTRQRFDLPLEFLGTGFQQKVWAMLVAIPFGTTRSYGELARELGDVKATRAVGAANGRNPISIIAACHRVVGSRGELTGFAGGLAAKHFLLEHEAAQRRLL